MSPLVLLVTLLVSGQVAPPLPPAAASQVQPLPVTPPFPAASATVSGPLPPQDWTTLPVLRFRRPIAAATDAASFVQGEVGAGRCPHAIRTPQGWSLAIDVALLASPDGRVRRVTPRAIDCPTVEQFAAGLLLGSARDNIDMRGAAVDTWYRTSMAFAWKP